jgi:hypothetical protein
MYSSGMTPANKKPGTLIVWAVGWAIAFILSAILFKGSPVKDWIQAALFIAALTFWLFKSQGLARPRC